MQLIIRLVLLSSVFHCCLAVLWKRCWLTKSRWTMERKKILPGFMQPGFTAQPSRVHENKNPKCMERWQESPSHNVCPECCVLLLRQQSWTDAMMPKWSCLNKAEGLAQTGLPDHNYKFKQVAPPLSRSYHFRLFLYKWHDVQRQFPFKALEPN